MANNKIIGTPHRDHNLYSFPPHDLVLITDRYLVLEVSPDKFWTFECNKYSTYRYCKTSGVRSELQSGETVNDYLIVTQGRELSHSEVIKIYHRETLIYEIVKGEIRSEICYDLVF